MYDQWMTFFSFIKVVIVFLVLYILIPSRLIRFDASENFWDKLFISLVHSSFAFILLVHILVYFHVYETFSLWFCCIVLCFFLSRRKKGISAGSSSSLGMKLISNIFDMSEGQAGFLREFKPRLRGWLKSGLDRLKSALRNFFLAPLGGCLLFVVLLGAAVIRFSHSFLHTSFSHIDAYLHMIWVKALGMNQIYYDQEIYPKGFHSILSAISKAAFIDPYWVFRFFGPLAGLLIVMSVFFFCTGITKSYPAGFIAVCIYGLVTNSAFPSVMFRQTASLSQEYSMVFLLPALYFLWLYISSDKLRFLLLFSEAAAIILLVHTYTAIILFILSMILILITIFMKRISINQFIKLAIAGISTGILSSLPFIIGFLLGNHMHPSSVGTAQGGISYEELLSRISEILRLPLFSSNIFIDLLIPGTVILVITAAVKWKSNKAVLSLAIALSTTFFTLLFRMPQAFPDVKLPELLETSRTGPFLALMLAAFLACLMAAMEEVVHVTLNIRGLYFKKVVPALLTFSLCAWILISFPPGKLYRGQEEYDSAAANYLKIKSTYSAYDWYVIAPHEQLAQVMGYGWHEQLIRFVQKYTLQQAADPNFEIPLPVTHIFVFTEKIPLHLGRPATSTDAQKALESEGPDPYMQYYKNTEQRTILEAKAIEWMETYKGSHKNVTVFFEDESMKIYHVTNSDPEKFLQKEGKE